MELETLREDLKKLVIDAYKASWPIKTVTSSRDVPWWNRNLAYGSLEILQPGKTNRGLAEEHNCTDDV